MTSLYDLGRIAAEKKNYDDAIAFFSEMKKSVKNKQDIIDDIDLNIAICYKEKNNMECLLKSRDMFIDIMNRKYVCKKFKSCAEINYVSAITMILSEYINAINYSDAFKLMNESLEILPKNPILNYNTGHLYKCSGNYEKATHYLLTALNYEKSHMDTYIELINIYNDLGNPTKTLEYIKLGLEYLTDNPYLYNELGCFYTKYDAPKALNTFEKAIKYSDDNKTLLAKIYTNIGHYYSIFGNIKLCLEYYKKAMESDDKDFISKQNYLMDLLYDDTIEYKEVLKQHLIIGTSLQKRHQIEVLPVTNYEHKILRIGYVSGDFFGSHPMTYFIKPLLQDFNKTKFAVYGYSINPIEQNNYDSSICWRAIKYLNTKECIKQILSDQIDILFDLSGHTAGNRMDIFSHRVARIQLSYLGYPCISGMPHIDYYIIDETFGFTGSKTISMKNCFTAYVPPFIPKILIQPYYTNNFITFGTLNKVAKINNSVVNLWDRLLDKYPNTKLVIKKNNYLKFRNSDRIIYIEPVAGFDKYVEQWNMIDIGLDPFPYSGTTSTCEALLMGTPVISLADRQNKRIHQNTTTSLLINSDLGHLVASDDNEFFEIVEREVKKIMISRSYKQYIQNKFLTGNVTNKKLYMHDYESLLLSLAK